MEHNQPLYYPTDFLSGFISLFIKLIFLIIIVYLVVLLMDFFRDKFINKVTDTKKDSITDLLTILAKVFISAGIGFIVANIVRFVFDHAVQGSARAWDYLTLGIILIFVAVGFNNANKAIRSNRAE